MVILCQKVREFHSLHINIHIFSVVVSQDFLQTVIYQVFLSNTDNLHTVVWFQVFLSNTNNYMVSSNYFYSKIIICLYIYMVSSNIVIVSKQ